MTFEMKLTGMQPLLRALDQMPVVMRARVVVPAVTKGIKTIERTIRPLIPFNRRRQGRKGRHAHYQTSLTSVVRDYPLTESVVGVVGAESGKIPHAVLVEDGTRQRFTNSKAVYRRLPTGVRTVIKNGQPRTKVVRRKQSIGSVQRRKNKPQRNRGVMPAFHPMKRGLDSSESTVRSNLEADIRSGITRELTASKLARGVS